ncbi:MAG: sigma-70 family RNA polymerase sigma factor [Fulvivirga sp.]
MSRSPNEIAHEYELIESYKKTHDLAILGKLYQPFMHLVYGVCLKYLKNREASQDAVMQVFELLVKKVKTHKIENFKSWLYVVTKNFCLMELRSKKHQIARESKDIDDGVVENELLLHHKNDSIDEDNLVMLEKCIDQLQKEQKTCIELFYLEKKSYKEVETLTHYDLKQVKSYIQNGKRNLKNCMESSEE